ncbi:uncharacterized protein N7479_008409 [Penicillium vulpinum]|uniref:Malate dehydrogenase n=1 Tax=Penicillium vulpinum TaxID=29845 RepID=A0A1V6REH0_9EURO|nr:uncharacterized protein N7479_008409 [Penicillium vulpinum]KAJ5961259.1 hypothetical protein N7479_008409 [Penicillium vulpinum]OQE00171.1 hypothetical protein PENVUL_c057G01300 [Penicillium vulpinum]
MRFALLIICLAAISLAAPTNFFDDAYEWTDELEEFFGKVSEYINTAKHNIRSPAACEASKIALPSYASGLTSPSGLKPKYVALGRGTQNYTCADSTSNSKPAAVGAVARLYNATCIAANYPDLLASLPNLAYKISLSTNEDASFPLANLELMGHHFFYDATTPEFNLNTTPKKQGGIVMTKKQGAIDAPSGAFSGKYGAVPWLYLTATEGTVGNYKSVYRVNTAAGSPPTTCKGMPPAFEMQYSANYYFFGE